MCMSFSESESLMSLNVPCRERQMPTRSDPKTPAPVSSASSVSRLDCQATRRTGPSADWSLPVETGPAVSVGAVNFDPVESGGEGVFRAVAVSFNDSRNFIRLQGARGDGVNPFAFVGEYLANHAGRRIPHAISLLQANTVSAT